MYTVMLAEDEEIYRKALASFVDWEKLDCRVVDTAANGAEVMERLETVRPDILITDIRMPGADGIEIVAYIQEKKLPVVSVILTAYADFSYAQAAFRYQVADYVVKSGAFEELTEAVEKAKKLVDEQRKKNKKDGREELFAIYKAIFDGSLFLENNADEKVEKVRMKKRYGRILLYLFRGWENIDETRRKRNSRSLQNFFSMVYGERLICAIPMTEERMAILLESDEPAAESWLLQKNDQAAGMMEDFMNLRVYIGLSEVFSETRDLKRAYREAAAVFDNYFLEDLKRTNFYRDIHREQNGYHPELEPLRSRLCQTVRLGKAEETRKLFQELLEQQRSRECPAGAVKESGILLKNECGRFLKEFRQSLHEVTGLEPGITKRITDCASYEEYAAVMVQILQGTASFFARTAGRKEYLLKRCREYIEQHYQEEFSVPELAKSLGTSGSYLSRIYSESTGSTLIYDLNRRRIEAAKYYLGEKQMRIYEVAELTGFRDATYFSHIFKTYTGMSPKQFQGKQE